MNTSGTGTTTRTGLIAGVIAMTIVVVASNYLVQFPVQPEQAPGALSRSVQLIFGTPINELFTWGAFTFPIAFLVNDLTNRRFGPETARKVVFVGFLIAVVISGAVAGWRIALASGSAFLVAQLLDTQLFNSMRQGVWWKAPVVSSTIASVVDTALFFCIAFAGTGLPWMTWAIGDYVVKLFVALVMLIPFRAMLNATRPVPA